MDELTVLWEDNVQVSYERKKVKYEELRLQCSEHGWMAYCYLVEEMKEERTSAAGQLITLPRRGRCGPTPLISMVLGTMDPNHCGVPS